MATRNSQDVDLSLENKQDYALAIFGGCLALGVLTILIVAPLYVFYTVGQMIQVGNTLLFGVGLYVLSAIYLYGVVN